jgi:hypothetical protein
MITDFYGDDLRWWTGIVIDTADPYRVGRVKVRIYGVHNEDKNEVPDAALPWASVTIPSTEGGVSGIGRQMRLLPGALVIGIFLDGKNSQQPCVVGSIPRIERSQPSTSSQAMSDTTVPTTIGTPQPRPWTASDVALVGNSNTQRAYNFLISLGTFTPITASAVIGNFLKESGMEPDIVSGVTNESSYGIAQWNPDAGRLQQLEDFAAERNLLISDLGTQLQFFVHDFSVLSPAFFRYNEFLAMTNVNRATDFFCDNYERPNSAAADKPTRRAYARQTLETYNGN